MVQDFVHQQYDSVNMMTSTTVILAADWTHKSFVIFFLAKSSVVITIEDSPTLDNEHDQLKSHEGRSRAPSRGVYVHILYLYDSILMMFPFFMLI